MQALKRFWRWSAGEVLVSRRWLLALTLLAGYALAWKTWVTWRWAQAPERNDQALLEKHERLVKKLWPNGFKPFVPVPAIAFTHPPDGSLGEHVCTVQGCGMWRVDREWECRVNGGKWDEQEWRCTSP